MEKSYYIVIPGVVRTDKRLSSDEQLLYGEITSLTNLHGYCWATNEYLATLMQASERTIQRYLKNLVACGHITITFDDTGNGATRKIFLMAATPTTQGVPKHGTPPHDKQRKKGGVKPVINNILSTEYSNVDNSNAVTSEEVTGAPPVVDKKEPGKPPVEIPPAPEPEIPKKGKSCYQLFIDIYDKWYKKFNDGVPPKYDNGNGNAAKSLIWYLRSIVKAKAQADGKGKLTEAQEDEQLLKSWQYVLNNWGLLDDFTQGKTRLVDISSNMQNIVSRIKSVNDGRQKPKSTTGQGHTDDGIKAELSKRFAQGNNVTD